MTSVTPRIAEFERLVRRGASKLHQLGTNNDAWTLLDENDGVKVYRKEADAEIPQSIFKGVTIVAAPAPIVVELVRDTSKKSSFDKMFDSATVAELISQHTKIEHQRYRAPWPVTNRDLCLIMNKARLEDGSICLFGQSVTHESVPEQSNYVRGEVFIGGWLVESIDTDRTRLTFITCTDLKGSIPNLIKQKLDRNQPGLVGAIRPLLAKRLEELSKMSESEREAVNRDLIKVIDELPVYTRQEIEDAKAGCTPSEAQ